MLRIKLKIKQKNWTVHEWTKHRLLTIHARIKKLTSDPKRWKGEHNIMLIPLKYLFLLKTTTKRNRLFLVYCFCLTKTLSTVLLQSFTSSRARFAFEENSFLFSYLGTYFYRSVMLFWSPSTPKIHFLSVSYSQLNNWDGQFSLVFHLSPFYNKIYTVTTISTMYEGKHSNKE